MEGKLPEERRPEWEAAERLVQERRYPEAARAWERLLNQSRGLSDEQTALVRHRLAQVYLHQALALSPLRGERKHALQALRLLHRAKDLDPNTPDYPYWCGVIHRRYRLWEKAAAYFREALAVDPRHPWSRLELGWALLRGDSDGAAEVTSLLQERPDEGSDDVPPWHWQRLEAAALLAARREREAFDVYPKVPPDAMPVDQWWKELATLAAAAVGSEPAHVLATMEKVWGHIQLLMNGADGEDGALRRDEILAYMGELASAAGDDERAWEYWRQIPKSSDVLRGIEGSMLRSLNRRAEAAFQHGDFDAAIALWQEAAGNEPVGTVSKDYLVRALVNRGNVAWSRGDVEKAIDAWSQAREYDSRLPVLWYNLAVGYEALGQWSEANRAWLEFLELQRSEVTSGTFDVEQVMERLAMNALRGGEVEEALKFLGRAGERVKRDPYRLTLAALLHLRAGKAQKGLDLLRQALQLDMGCDPAAKGLDHALRMQAVQGDELIKIVKPMLDQCPPDRWAHRYARDRIMALGIEAYHSGALDRAMEHFASVLLRQPDDVEAWLWSGAVHMRKDNVEGYEDCFAEGVRLAPDKPETYIFIGVRFLAAGDRERAEDYFTQALKVNSSPSVRTMIGEAYAEMGLPEVAEEYFQDAIAADSPEKPSLVLRAVCSLVQAGAEDKVEPFLIHATRLAPDMIEARILLAALAIRRRDWLTAQSNLHEAGQLIGRREDQGLRDHVVFFQHAIILLRTVGEIDEEAFNERIQAVLAAWINQDASQYGADGGRLESLPELIDSLVPAWEGLNPLPVSLGKGDDDEEPEEGAGRPDVASVFAFDLPLATLRSASPAA